MSEELLPCPFCGDREYVISAEEGSRHNWYRVCCDNCTAKGEMADSKQQAVKLWNTRTPSLDWIVNRAVELGQETEICETGKIITGDRFQHIIFRNNSSQILQIIKKELGEKL